MWFLWKIFYLSWFSKRAHKKYSQRSQIFTLTSASNLRKHIKIIHKVHEEFKCDSSGKSFTVSNTMKAIHKDHKDFICGSCRKLFEITHQNPSWRPQTGATSLRIHIKTIHEDHKDFDLIGTKALAKEIKCQLFFCNWLLSYFFYYSVFSKSVLCPILQ